MKLLNMIECRKRICTVVGTEFKFKKELALDGGENL